MFEYSAGGDIDHALFSRRAQASPLSKFDRLRVGVQIAHGVAASHYTDDDGRATIAHTDITGSQFVFIDGIFKLNDFNRARFLRIDGTNRTCPFHVQSNLGDFRAPEEYAYQPETEQVDVYSMGNLLYQLLTRNYYLFGTNLTDEAAIARKVVEGHRPRALEDLLAREAQDQRRTKPKPMSTESNHTNTNNTNTNNATLPYTLTATDRIFLTAIDMCFVHDPRNRSTADEVAEYLQEQLNDLIAAQARGRTR